VGAAAPRALRAATEGGGEQRERRDFGRAALTNGRALPLITRTSSHFTVNLQIREKKKQRRRFGSPQIGGREGVRKGLFEVFPATAAAAPSSQGGLSFRPVCALSRSLQVLAYKFTTHLPHYLYSSKSLSALQFPLGPCAHLDSPMASPPPPSGPSPGAGPSRAPGEPQDPLLPLIDALGTLTVSDNYQLCKWTSKQAKLASECRESLIAYAATQGHPSVEAWLRALRPEQLTKSSVIVITHMSPEFTAAEQAAAADLFRGPPLRVPPGAHAASRWNSSMFHPSLMDSAAPIFEEQGDGYMLPCVMVPKLRHISR
jgi:hypothetical protein